MAVVFKDKYGNVEKPNAKQMDFVKLYGVLGAIADKKNPNVELNYILVDGDKVVVTDTRFMLIVDYELNHHVDGQVLLDTGKSTGLRNDIVVAGIAATTEGKYPEYTRIQSKETTVVYTCKSIQEALALYPHFAGSGEAYIDMLGLGAKFKKLQTITQSVDVIKLSYAMGPITLKLTLLGGSKAELIVMPTVVPYKQKKKQ